ncbi:hypothetical protein [Rhodopseudomonas palustris]|uniref:hypothetical protein n=1 Tax=Rhodopseudomonas palustris TaxID=1076 RepID=UPI0011B0922C|nr:hypothetical protein [Rhodopseudomonas palustris]
MWTVLDWLLNIVLVVGFIGWAIWFAMRVIKAYALAEGSGWRRLGAALVAVLLASWATIVAPFKALWISAAKSLTILSGYAVVGLSQAIDHADDIAGFVADPAVQEKAQQLQQYLGPDAKFWTGVISVVAVLFILSRARSMIFKPKPAE